jgi:hypothetical protein
VERCAKILGRYERAEDYVEISLESEYRYNPLHNDLDAYALAYYIASLLNNLFGRGKKPFWQQAYTNLVRFIILPHKVAFDYVTLFDVYECAINPHLLESRIKEAQRRLIEDDSILLSEEEYLKYPRDLDRFGVRLDKELNPFRAPLTPGLAAVLKENCVEWDAENASRKNPVPAQKKAQLEAVIRWHDYDWKRIEPKLRTSIVGGQPKFRSGNSRVGGDTGRVPHEHAQSKVGRDFSLRQWKSVVQRVLRHAKPHVTKRYIKVFDPAVLEAMQKMQTTLEQLRRGQQLASSLLPFDGKMLKVNAGEVAERLKAAVC